MLRFNRDNLTLYIMFAIFLTLNICLWTQTHKLRPVWGNVPPATSDRATLMMNMGDSQLAYRRNGMMLQNLGNEGGDSTPLKDYNFELLRGWFMLQDRLDPVSNFMPYLTAYYFGATQNPRDQLGPVIDYLEVQGQRSELDKWRWLAEAVFLARYKKSDMPRALDLANKLAALPNVPLWAKAMPAFVLRADGDKEGAYTIMMGILSSSSHSLSPYEIRLLRDNICNQTLTPAEAAKNELCINVK
ncbi:MAG: hypothetical protein JWO78_356 [Micavibrio sp.]|nr:hypothetical protein [Micavibrio sp.]